MNVNYNDVLRCFVNRGIPIEHAKRIMSYVSVLDLDKNNSLEVFDIMFACIDNKYLVSPVSEVKK